MSEREFWIDFSRIPGSAPPPDDWPPATVSKPVKLVRWVRHLWWGGLRRASYYVTSIRKSSRLRDWLLTKSMRADRDWFAAQIKPGTLELKGRWRLTDD